MIELYVDGGDQETVNRNILEAYHKQKLDEQQDYYMIITGDALRFIDKNPSKELIHLTLAVKTVIACRVSPKQKQEVVELVRRTVKSTHST
jgi:magnesium-transporting ATPase (P-type)